jgi:2,3-bisphosphoglycerate-dependent phosphoglycerate mutase
VAVNFQRPFAAPDGARAVLLVRHGAVDPPEPDGLVAGRSDPPLNDAGRRQAQALAARLTDEPAAALFTTPMIRTAQTAAPVAERLGLQPIEATELGEVYLGEWEGHGIAIRAASEDAEFVAMMRVGRWDLIPGAEPAEDFGRRARAGLDRVADAAGDGTLAIAVTHAGVIAEVLRQITGSEPFAFLACSNGSISRIVRMPDRRWMLLSFNETAHLVGDGR